MAGLEAQESHETAKADVLPASATAGRAVKRWPLAAVVTAGILALTTAAVVQLREIGLFPTRSLQQTGMLNERDTILVADFISPPDDSTLGATVAGAFRIELANSGVVTMAADRLVQFALSAVHRGGRKSLDPDVAREVALRVGVKAYIAGEVRRTGGKYILAARLLTPADSSVLYEDYSVASNADHILDPALDHLTRRFRARMGESLGSLVGIGGSAPGVLTTRSIDAMKVFFQGVRVLTREPWNPRAVTLFEQAIAIDSNFVEAYRRLGVALQQPVLFDDGRTKSWWALQHAYDRRNKEAPYYAALVEGAYWSLGGHRDLSKAITAYERAIELKPWSSIATNNLGVLYRSRREYSQADYYLRRCDSVARNIPLTFLNRARLASELSDTANTRKLLDSSGVLN